MLGVVQLVDPLNNNVPPVDALYQSIVSPAPGVADNVTVPVPHRDALVAIGIDGNALMVAVTATRDADVQLVVVFLACA